MARKTVVKAHRFRFYPTDEQAAMLERTFGCVRLVYNKALHERTQQWYENQISLNYVDTAKWRNSDELGFLSEVSVVPLQQSLRHLQTAFQNFWKKRAAYPRFKFKKKTSLALEYSKAGFSVKDGNVYIAKSREPLAITYTRDISLEDVTTLTVKKDRAGRWFVSLRVKEDVREKPVTGKTVGIDLGVKDAVICDNGSKYNPSDMYDLSQKQNVIRRRQKELSRKQKGSKNREKAKLKLARAHARKADAHRDWLHKTTTKLMEQYDVICLEDLNVRGMTRRAYGRGVTAKSGLNRAIIENSFSEFRRMLEYKADWYGKHVTVIDRFYPSTKRCSYCGFINHEMTLSTRFWTCSKCDTHHDRDINAATNIKAAGLAVLACGDSVSLTS